MAVTAVRTLTSRMVFITRDIVWRAPVSNIALYGLLGLGMVVLLRRMPRTRSLALLAGLFVFLAAVGPVLQVPRLHPYAALFLALGVAVQAARLTGWHTDVASRLVRRSLPFVAVPCLLLAAGYLGIREVRTRQAITALPPASSGAPNVLVIVLDTVRARSLGVYGSPRPTSPKLDAFARTGVLFEHAFSPAPWTLPSHASMFTGLVPKALTADWLHPLDQTQATLAEEMQRRGYATVGEVANLLYTTSATGLDRGFLRYSDFPFSVATFMHQSWLTRPIAAEVRRNFGQEDKMVRKSAAQVTDSFLDWLPGRPDAPFFAFLNYFDAHAPYLPPAPYDTMFGHGPLPDVATRRQWSPPEIQRSLDAYEGSVAYIDAELGRLLESLAAQGILEDTVVVITSDHGEQFGEHGLFDHANSLYRAVLHVPFIVSYPRRVPAGVRVSTPVSLVDLPATVLDLVGTERQQAMPGRSLVDAWTGVSDGGRAVFSQVSRGINLAPHLPVSRGNMVSVIVDGVHYIRNGDGVEELYDFEHDEQETTNLAGRPDMQERLLAARSAVATVDQRR